MVKILVLFFFCAGSVFAVETIGYYANFQSLFGYTGNIVNPSTEVLSIKRTSLGINRFNVGLTYGIFKHIETGLHFNLENLSPLTALDAENVQRKLDEISWHSKIGLISADKHGFNLSTGHFRSTLYVVSGFYFKEYHNIGIDVGIRFRYFSPPPDKFKPFLTLTQTQSGHRFMFDYDTADYSSHFGWRFLLSPDVAMDLLVVDFLRYRAFFDNFYFGVSIVWA